MSTNEIVARGNGSVSAEQGREHQRSIATGFAPQPEDNSTTTTDLFCERQRQLRLPQQFSPAPDRDESPSVAPLARHHPPPRTYDRSIYYKNPVIRDLEEQADELTTAARCRQLVGLRDSKSPELGSEDENQLDDPKRREVLRLGRILREKSPRSAFRLAQQGATSQHNPTSN
ncbi:hypothetical protein MMC19_003349 [Ptychographa xylographoides]|nr:hypothetical protein [Ptychographa xylographoides]